MTKTYFAVPNPLGLSLGNGTGAQLAKASTVNKMASGREVILLVRIDTLRAKGHAHTMYHRCTRQYTYVYVTSGLARITHYVIH